MNVGILDSGAPGWQHKDLKSDWEHKKHQNPPRPRLQPKVPEHTEKHRAGAWCSSSCFWRSRCWRSLFCHRTVL